VARVSKRFSTWRVSRSRAGCRPGRANRRNPGVVPKGIGRSKLFTSARSTGGRAEGQAEEQGHTQTVSKVGRRRTLRRPCGRYRPSAGRCCAPRDEQALKPFSGIRKASRIVSRIQPRRCQDQRCRRGETARNMPDKIRPGCRTGRSAWRSGSPVGAFPPISSLSQASFAPLVKVYPSPRSPAPADGTKDGNSASTIMASPTRASPMRTDRRRSTGRRHAGGDLEDHREMESAAPMTMSWSGLSPAAVVS
jgi:hypothetical protein